MTDGFPTVSIVTPSLNQRDFIAAAIRSVRAQDYPALEHVVVDGGSTDGTVDVLKSFDHLVWVSERDAGQSDAVNKGFAMARGDVFGWLNADDLYLPGAVAGAVAALHGTDAGLVYAGYVKRDLETGWEREIRTRPFDMERQVNQENVVPQPAAFFTREAFQAAGGLDTRLHYAMDYDLWLRIAERCPVVWVDEMWAVFQLHPDSKTMKENDRFWREERAVARRHGGRFLSSMYVEHVRTRSPHVADALGRLSRGSEMLRRHEYARLLRRIKETALGR